MSAVHEAGWVSVIVPTYNRASLLMEALESVRAQSYRPIELVVVDDGSTDATEDAVVRWPGADGAGDWRLHYLRQRNAGAPAARNRGLASARGEFVQYLDSDDTLGSGKIAAQVAALRAHPEWDVVAGDSFELETGAQTEPREPLTRESGLARCITSWTLPVNNPLFRRRACERIGPWDAGMRCFEDASYMASIFCAGLVLGYVGGAPSYIRGHRATTGAEQGPRVSFRGEPQRAHDEVLALYRHHCHVCARFPADRRGVQPYASALAKEGFRVARKLMQVGEGEKARELLDLHELASHSPRLRADRASLRALARVVGERRAATWHERAYDWLHDLRRGGRR